MSLISMIYNDLDYTFVRLWLQLNPSNPTFSCFLLSLSDVGKPNPLLAVKRNCDGSSFLALGTRRCGWLEVGSRVCLTGIRGPRPGGTASYSGKSSGAGIGMGGGRGLGRGWRETGGKGVAEGGGGLFTGGKGAAAGGGGGLNFGKLEGESTVDGSDSFSVFWNSNGSY